MPCKNKRKGEEMGKPNRLTYQNRLQISAMLYEGNSIQQIANTLGVHFSTVYREINRGSIDGEYTPEFSQHEYEKKIRNRSQPILKKKPELAIYLSHLINDEKLSPEEIANFLKNDNHHQYISCGTIYNGIYAGLIPGVTRDSLKKTSTKIFNEGQIHIPTWIKNELKWEDGDLLDIRIDQKNNTLIFTKK